MNLNPPTIIVILVLATSLGVYAGVTLTSPAHAGFPFFEPFDSDEDMWGNIMAAYPTYDTMTDLQKTTALRTWASQHMYVSGNVNYYNHDLFNNKNPYKIFNLFSTFKNGNAGVMCSGYSHALCVLYAYAGFPTIMYEHGGYYCDHAVTLVRIMDAGEPKIIVQDAYFDYYYAWPDGTAMSIYDIFAEVEARRYENVIPIYEKTIDYAVFAPFTNGGAGYGFEWVAKIDHDSVIYRFWYTPENYYTSPEYIAAKNAAYGEIESDLELITKPRRIIFFSAGLVNRPSLQSDFSILEM